MLKRTVCILMTVCLLCLCLSCIALAETNWTAKFTAKQTASENEDGIVTVRVSVSNITSTSGIICAIYNLYYDTDCLELVAWKNGMPSAWDFSESSTLGAEDWSQIVEENGKKFFFYTLVNVAAENGVTENDVLYTELQFKVLDDSAASTELKFSEIAFTDVDDLEHGTTLELADQNLVLELDAAGSGNTSTETSVDTSSSENSQGEAGDTTSAPADNSSDIVIADNQVVVDITLTDIKDPAGVSSLLFHVKYNGRLLKYISNEWIKPDNWLDDTLYTENMTPAEQTNGDLLFWMLNVDPTCGVKEDGVLGFRITFEVSEEIQFDPSLLTIEQVEICNSELKELSADDYSFSIVQVGGENLTGDGDSEGQIVKIVIIVVAVVLVLGGAVAAWYFIRKKNSK